MRLFSQRQIKKNNPLTQEELKKLLRYDAETGVFTWATDDIKGRNLGDIAGTYSNNMPRQICVNGGIYNANRLAWLYMTGSWPKGIVGRRNKDFRDDSWENLYLKGKQPVS